jgi:hypothetical protein
MKSLRWLLMAALLLSVHCRGWPAFPADPPAKVAAVRTSKQTIPQSLLDALALCERDREAIVTAQATVDAAMKAKAKAVLDCENDYKALVALLESLYGPTPQPPQPPKPPEPPVVVLPRLTLVTATGSWCQACLQTESDTVPGLKANAGITFKSVLYTDDAAKIYAESALVPRWVLTRPDGKVEKKIGYLTTEQLDQWIGKGAKP